MKGVSSVSVTPGILNAVTEETSNDLVEQTNECFIAAES